jgi:hypothetical protein
MENEMGRASSAYGREARRIQDFGVKTGEKRPLGRPKRRWEDNIKINLQEVWTGTSWLRIGTGTGHL